MLTVARIFNINTRAPMLLVKAFAPHLNASGRIISISSIMSRSPYPGFDAYSVSKLALEGLTRQWAVTLAKDLNITANAVVCGTVETDFHANTPKAALDAVKAQTSAAERLGTTKDIADVVVWLASDEARWINGQCVGVHGGFVFN
jgi:3-oxoacyl-[acyl-carrier protein] reductase